MKARYLPPLAALLGLTSCVIDRVPAGPVQYSSESVDVDNSEQVRVDLKMAVGDLRVIDGGQKLVRADFSYNVPSWKPEVHYTRDGTRGSLVIEQPGTTHTTTLGKQQTRWDLQLSNKVPMDLSVHFGAGQARLDLGSLLLRGVEVDMGVGQMEMDLRGKVRHSYNVNIRGGVGEATVRLPADAGIYAEAHGGIGSINVRGLRHEGDHWVSESYEQAENKIRIDVQGGIGAIKLVAD
jgi:predicted membrane protein